MTVPWVRFSGAKQVALTVLLILASTSASSSQEAAAPLALAGIAHVAIRTENLADARSFFEKLGFLQAFELTKDGTPTEDFIKISDNQFLELYPAQGELPLGFMHICYESTQIETLNAAYATRGTELTPVKKAGAGNLLFVLHGPEQQIIEFTQYMPGSLHSKDRGKHLGKNRLTTQLTGIALSLREPDLMENYYVQRLGFRDLRINEQTKVLVLPGDSGQTVGLLPIDSKPAFALIFSVADLDHLTKQLQKAGVTPSLQKDRVVIEGPEHSLIIFTSKPASLTNFTTLSTDK